MVVVCLRLILPHRLRKFEIKRTSVFIQCRVLSFGFDCMCGILFGSYFLPKPIIDHFVNKKAFKIEEIL